MRIRTLLPMACDGVGPSQTCINIVRGMHHAGADVDVLVNRMRIPRKGVPARALLAGPFARIPYPWVSRLLTEVLERWYLRRLEGDELAYLWPAASLGVHREVHRRSIPIVLEGINTRMKSAKDILDRAYHDFGAEPSHGITQARIDEEEEKLSLASAIFAPSVNVENALADGEVGAAVLSTSYGIHVPIPLPRKAASNGRETVFVFCGYGSIRKGMHHLLEAWSSMPKTAKLRILGRIEPLIANRFHQLLESDHVEVLGFVDDVALYFATSDVFVLPSLEEGDPLVTYEAALSGLPLMASTMGAGRMAKSAWIIDPANRSEFLAALQAMHADPDLRDEWARRAQTAVVDYDWFHVAASRLHSLVGLFGGDSSSDIVDS